MTESSFLRELIRLLSEPFYDLQWLNWKTLVIATPAIILLFFVVRRLLRGAAEEEPVTEIQEHPHIIGARLVKSKQHQEEIKETDKDHRADVEEKLREDQSPDETTEQVERLNWEIDLLKLRIAKQNQTEARLDQKVAELARQNEQLRNEIATDSRTIVQPDPRVAELAASNEQLLQEVAESKQIETQLRQEIGELTACNEQLHQEANDTRDYLEQQLVESQAANERLQSQAAENDYVEAPLKLTARLETAEVSRQVDGMLSESPEQARGSNQSKEPLDANTLHAIAQLIKRIQRHPRQN